MKVNMEITFSTDEIKAMISERVSGLTLIKSNKLKVLPRYGYIPEVTVHFDSGADKAEDAADDTQPPAPAQPEIMEPAAI